MTTRCALYMGVLKIFESLSMPMATFPEIFKGRLFRSIVWMCIRNLKFVALPVPGYANAPFSLKQDFVQMDPGNVSAKFEVRRFACSWDNSDWSFGWGLQPPILGKRRPCGVGDGTIRKSVGESYTPSIVTFPLSLRIPEILLLLCSSTPIFSHPTSTLPQISPVSRWMVFGIRREKVLG